MSEALERWRLVLGASSEEALGSLTGANQGYDAALAWLYDRTTDEDRARDIGQRLAGTGPSSMDVPEWINQVQALFPKETIERLERDAIERYEINEVVTNPEVLKRVEPNTTLLKAVLKTKHLMNAKVLGMARELVAKVVRRLIDTLATEVRASFGGVPTKRRSHIKLSKNFDAKATIRKNLANYDPETQKLFITRPLFFTRTRRHVDKWKLIIVVDESGSMMDSVIHAAVTAACLWGLPSVKTHLCIFDTEVVDLTEQVTDPVEVLMKVQLGGGTDIAKAMRYAAGLVESPRKSIVVLITDFFEGGNADDLVRTVKDLSDQGSLVLGLAALDSAANPNYDKALAERLVNAGAHVGAMTPGELVGWIAQKVRR